MKIGFTGTQKGMTTPQIKVVEDLLRDPNIEEVHHGDCIGSDEKFHILAFNNTNIPIVIHPPENQTKRAYCGGAREIYPKKPYLIRNADIVKETDTLIATPKEFKDVLRSGTWSTIRKGIKLWKRVIIVFPDGSIKRYN